MTRFKGRPGYSADHFRRLHGTPDTPQDITERIQRRAAGEQAHAEMLAKFSPLTPANAEEAIRWQEARIKALMTEAAR
jgi:hypothetical protein